ncbi:hypothetical protein NCS52_00876800 [Fusarium sp. LHS14.1]|nr:hypothetical protein NCS52_00876800 [Fusarium sp. LHS14.1]
MEFKLIEKLPEAIFVGQAIDPPIQARCSAQLGAYSARLTVHVDGRDSEDLLCGLTDVTPRQYGNHLFFKFCLLEEIEEKGEEKREEKRETKRETKREKKREGRWPRFTAAAEGRVRLRVTLFQGERIVAMGLTKEVLVKKDNFDYQQWWVRRMETQRATEEDRDLEYLQTLHYVYPYKLNKDIPSSFARSIGVEQPTKPLSSVRPFLRSDSSNVRRRALKHKLWRNLEDTGNSQRETGNS